MSKPSCIDHRRFDRHRAAPPPSPSPGGREGGPLPVGAMRAGKALVEDCAHSARRQNSFKANVRKEDDVAIWSTRPSRGFGRLDVAVNNAAPKVGRPITDQTAESFAATSRTNVLGVFLR